MSEQIAAIVKELQARREQINAAITALQPAKRRGRPPKHAVGARAIHPHGKRRGRPPGSKNKAKRGRPKKA